MRSALESGLPAHASPPDSGAPRLIAADVVAAARAAERDVARRVAGEAPVAHVERVDVLAQTAELAPSLISNITPTPEGELFPSITPRRTVTRADWNTDALFSSVHDVAAGFSVEKSSRTASSQRLNWTSWPRGKGPR